MTQTVGYWCDECRQKYVQHTCHDGLPCGHDKSAAIYVYAKSWGRGGELVEMHGPGVDIEVWLTVKEREPGVMYIGRPPRVVETEEGPVGLWEWLSQFHAPVIRAFEERWLSCKFPPTWRQIEQWTPQEPVLE